MTLHPVDSTILSGLNKQIVAAELPNDMKGQIIVIPVTYDPARISDEAYVCELREFMAKSFEHGIKGLGFELLRANDLDALTCEDCGATGQFGRTWPVDFCVGAKIVCSECISVIIRAEGLTRQGAVDGEIAPPSLRPITYAADGRPVKWFKRGEVVA